MASHRLSVEKVVGTLFEDELSLDESNNKDVYGYLGEPILRCSKIEVESLLLLHEDLGSKDQDEDTVVDGDEDYMCNDEEGVVRSGDSDNCDSHSETGGRSSSCAGDKTEQDEVVGEIILFE